MNIKHIIREYVLNGEGLLHDIIASFYTFLWRQKRRIIRRERRASYGERNPDKTLYVIRSGDGYSGLFAHFNYLSAHIFHAITRGSTPVIDMQTNNTWLLDETSSEVDTLNVWEYYFEQPCGIDLQEALQSKNVIHARDYLVEDAPLLDLKFLTEDSDLFVDYCGIVNKYMRYNAKTKRFLEDAWDSTMPSDGHILAVMSRGTDYNILRPKNHPIQPSAEELIEQTKVMMDTYDIKYLYVNSEERFVLEKFKNTFGDIVFHFNTRFYDDYDPDRYSARPRGGTAVKDDICIGVFIENSTKIGVYRSNLEYLRAIYGASRCDYLLAGLNGGTVGAILLNNCKYKHKHIIFKGVY